MQRLYEIFYFLVPFILVLLFVILVGQIEGSESISRTLLTVIGVIVTILIIVSMVIYYFLLRARIGQVVPETGEVTQKELLEAIDQSNIGYAIMNQQGQMIFCSDSAHALLVPAEGINIIGKIWYEIDAESSETKRQRRQTWEKFIKERGEWQGIIRWRTHAGEQAYFDANVNFLESGRVILVINDRTDRVKAVQKLAANEKLHNYILDNIPMSVTIQNINDEKIVYTNEYLPMKLGFSAKDIIGKTPHDLSRAAPVKPLIDLIAQIKATHKPIEAHPTSVTAGLLAGTHWLIYLYPIFDKDKRLVQLLAMSFDITDRVELSQEKELFSRKLYETQKVEALNKFAGGLAHELSNLLHPAGVYARALGDNPDHEEREKYLSRINRAVLKSGAILRQTLSMSRADSDGPKAHNLNTLLTDQIEYSRDIAPKGISYALTMPEVAIHALVDETELRQVMMNLLVNAIDAQGGTGTINVKLGYGGEISGATGIATTATGPFAWIDVIDTGSGMSETTRTQIFDPFFTTKDKGKGTGLGLAVVQGMVTGWGGVVSVDTKLRKGSTFRVWMPMALTTGALQPIIPTVAKEKLQKEQNA